MRHWIISLVAFVMACIGTLCGLFVVTDQGRASADLDNSFVTHRDKALDTVFSHPLPNADPYFDPRILSWQRQAWGYPRPCLVSDHSPDGRFYYAKLEGGVVLQNLLLFFILCWLVLEALSFLWLCQSSFRAAQHL